MRRWIIRLILITLLLGGTVAMWRYAHRDEIRAAAIERTGAELRATIIPHFELRDASFAEAVTYLETEAHRAGLRGDIHFVILSDAEIQRRLRRRLSGLSLPVKKGLPALTATSSVNKTRVVPSPITISMTTLPVDPAISYIAKFGLVAYRITPQAVEFADPTGFDGTLEPLITRTFSFDPRFFSRSIHSEDLWPNGRRDARTYLEKVEPKLTFYEGTFAEYDPRRSTIRIRNTWTQIDWLKDFAEPSIVDQIRDRIREWFRSEPETPIPTAPAPAVPPIPSG
ncbi:MAG: hypothetical protein ABI680_18465 [Chthoniobacteraceae bacterium]